MPVCLWGFPSLQVASACLLVGVPFITGSECLFACGGFPSLQVASACLFAGVPFITGSECLFVCGGSLHYR